MTSSSAEKEYPPISKKYEEYYSDLLYKLLPAIYQSKDKEEAGYALRQFLKIIAEQAALMRRDIDGLWADFFIDTCKPWVIPYIGDLVGTNLVLNEAARNRSDVKRTIFWRRRKGTISALEDLANFITGWNAKAIEFFQLLVWSQNLRSLKFHHLHTPDMRDSVALDRIYRTRDATCHNIDLRDPDQSQGWYNIKNIGFFFSRQQIFQIRNGSPIEDVRTPAAMGPGMDPAVLGFRFYFDPAWKPLANAKGTPPPPLYDKHSRRPIRKADFAFDPYLYFGSDRGMSVMTYNIVAANQRQEGIENLSRFAGRAQVIEFLRFEKLAADRGIWLLEPRKFADPRRVFELSIIDWNPLNQPTPFTELGKLTITSDTIQFTKQLEVLPQDRGYTLIRVKIDNNSEPCIFPQTVIGIRRSDHSSRSADSLESRFSDALYAYLPEFLLANGEQMYFLIGEDGSTFYTNNNGKFRKGNPQFYPENDAEILRKTENTARRSLGQIFPARLMSNSYLPVNGFLRLNRDHGVILPDKSRPAGQHFVIVAHSRSGQAQALVPLGSLNTTPGQTYQASDPSTPSESQALASAEEEGVLIMSVQPVNDSDPNAVFPMSELILTNRSNQSLLVYLPEIGGEESSSKTWYKWDSDAGIHRIKYFFVADDGSSFYCSPEEARNPHFQQRDNTDESLIFSPRNLARKSAGQILPMPGQVPIQLRVPISYDINDSVKSKKFNPLPGELGIDPVNGIFCFPEADFFGPDKPAKSSLSVSYNYGFPYVIGAGSFDRSIQASFGKDLSEKKYGQINNMPTFWVSKSLDVADNRADKKTIFGTLKDALDAAKNIQGSVVIQIQDSSLYIEDPIDYHSLSVKSLTIQSANGQRPTLLVKGSGINIQSDLETLTLNGLLILAHDASTSSSNLSPAINAPIITLSGIVKEIHIVYSTINPSLRAIRLGFSDENNNNNLTTTFVDFAVDKSILGGLDCGKIRTNNTINNSIVDCSGVILAASEEIDNHVDGGNNASTLVKELDYSIVGSRVSRDIDRSTLYGKISVDILSASETIFDGLVMVRNRQEGCVRYSRFRRLSYLFNWTGVRSKDGTTIPDNDKLAEFLLQNFNDMEWVENADITKDDEDTITLKTSGGGNNSNSVMLHLNDNKTGASLVIDEKNYQLVAKPSFLDSEIISIFAFSSFPRLYRCTDTMPLFNSRLPWDPHYMQLNVKCEKDVLEGAENKSEMGVYYYGYYSLAANNFRIKLKEYLPLMLKPAAIMEE